MRDKGEEVGRHQIIKDSEELLEVKWLIFYLVGKWKPMEDLEQRNSMIRHMLQED